VGDLEHPIWMDFIGGAAMVICFYCVYKQLVKTEYDKYEPYCTNKNSPLYDMWLVEKTARAIGCIYGKEDDGVPIDTVGA